MVLCLPFAHVPAHFAEDRHGRHPIDPINLGEIPSVMRNKSWRRSNRGTLGPASQESWGDGNACGCVQNRVQLTPTVPHLARCKCLISPVPTGLHQLPSWDVAGSIPVSRSIFR